MSISYDHTVPPTTGTSVPPGPVALPVAPLLVNDSRHDRFEQLRSLTRRLNREEVRQLSSSVMIRFERIGAELVVNKVALDDDGAERIRREAGVLERLRHPRIVQVESFTDGPRPTLTTTFAGRATLATLLPDDIGTVARALASLCSTVTELHRSGWAHGNLTADHCAIGPSGHLTLCSLADATDAPNALDEQHDRLAIATIGAALISALPSPQNRQERADRKLVRRALDDIVAGSTGFEATAVDRFTEVARRRAMLGAGGVSTTCPRQRTGAMATTPTPPSKSKAVLTTTATLIALIGALVGLRVIGGPVRLPATGNNLGGDGIEIAASAISAVLRLAAFGAAAYGVALCVLTLIAITTGRAEVQRVVVSMSTPRVRAVLIAVMGIGAITSVAPQAFNAHADALTPIRDTGAVIEAAIGDDGELVPVSAVGEAVPIETVAADDVAASGVSQVDTWTVERGDHLWGIAESVLSSVRGAEVSEAEVATYWAELIDINRDALVDADNPDLIYAGQVVVLPPVV